MTKSIFHDQLIKHMYENTNNNINENSDQRIHEIAFVLGSFILPKYIINGFNQTDKELPIKFDKMTLDYQTTNFFGFLGDKSMNQKKECVLLIYKLVYRFSIEKL